MDKPKKKKIFDVRFEKRNIPVSLIDVKTPLESFEKKDLKTRMAYFVLNGAPEFSVNEKADGRFDLLALERDFYAVKYSGVVEVTAKVYAFSENHAEAFSITEKLKNDKLGVMEEGYLMKQLIEKFSFTQEDISSLIGKSRPAVANTLRLLTLTPEVIGLIESGQLSAGHARTLVKIPKPQQLAFAETAIKRGYSVRDMERTVRTFLTPPEILAKEKQAISSAKNEQLKSFIERMRRVYGTKVSLIGNDKKGRIYIDYYSPEDLYRFEEFLDMIESFNDR